MSHEGNRPHSLSLPLYFLVAMTTWSPHNTPPPCSYKFSYSYTWTLTGFAVSLTYAHAHTHAHCGAHFQADPQTHTFSCVKTNTKYLHIYIMCTYLRKEAENANRHGNKCLSSKIYEVISFRNSKYKTEVQDYQSPL